MSLSEPSFRAEFSSAGYFSKIVRAISSVIDEGPLIATPDGLRFTALEPSHTVLVDLELGSGGMNSYWCEGEEVGAFVNVNDVLRLLKKAGTEPLTLEFYRDERRLRLTFKEAGRERDFTLKTLDLPSSMQLPTLSFEAACEVETRILHDAVMDALLLADYVKVTVSPEALSFSCNGENTAYQARFESTGASVRVLSGGEVSSTYSLGYLKEILPSSRTVNEWVTLELSKDKPLRLRMLVVGGRLDFYVAPRVV